MCFGNMQTSNTTTNTPTPNAAVASAATSNLTDANNLQSAGFTPYTGNQVANFGPLQSQSFGDLSNGQIPGAIGSYMSNPTQSVSPQTISSAMSPYMNQYVSDALAPQIAGQNQQFAAQDQQLDAAATSSGAYGDARAGIQAANLTNQQNLAQQGLIGSAYNSAFNTAIGAGAQDVANNLQGQTTNANLEMAANQQQLTGAQALEGYTGMENTFGQQQTAQSQAGLNAQYNQYLMAQQYPFQTLQAEDQAIGTAAQAMPASTTSVTQTPNNEGYAMLGALGGAAMNYMLPGSGMLLSGAMSGGSGQPLTGQPSPNGPASYAIGYAAEGGHVPAGQPTVVGEKGPELFIPHTNTAFADAFTPQPQVIGAQGPEMIQPQQSGTVIPHHVLKRLQDQHKTVMEHANKRRSHGHGLPGTSFSDAFSAAA